MLHFFYPGVFNGSGMFNSALLLSQRLSSGFDAVQTDTKLWPEDSIFPIPEEATEGELSVVTESALPLPTAETLRFRVGQLVTYGD